MHNKNKHWYKISYPERNSLVLMKEMNPLLSEYIEVGNYNCFVCALLSECETTLLILSGMSCVKLENDVLVDEEIEPFKVYFEKYGYGKGK